MAEPVEAAVDAVTPDAAVLMAVLNQTSRVWHATPQRSNLEVADEITLCGWKFGGLSSAEDMGRLLATWHNLCAKCYAGLRLQRKHRALRSL